MNSSTIVPLVDLNNHISVQRKISEARVSQRYLLRYILTEALIRLSNDGDSPEGMENLPDRLVTVLEVLENGNIRLVNESGKADSSLPNSFIESVRKSANRV